MNRRIVNIQSLEDLELQERKVRKRIKETEIELGKRVKQIPEEIISAALMKLITSVVEGKAIKTLAGIAKKIGKSAIFNIFKEDEE